MLFLNKLINIFAKSAFLFYYLFLIKYMWVILVDKVIEVSSVPLHRTRSVHGLCARPPQSRRLLLLCRMFGPFSLPPPPPPSGSQHITVYVHGFQFHTPLLGEVTWFLTFSVWLTSFSIISSRFIHIVANGRISSFLMAEYYSIVYMCHVFFI